MLLKKFLFPVTCLVAFLIILLFVFSSAPKPKSDNLYHAAMKRSYKIFSPQIPEKMVFAGENVPLENFYVRESLDREIVSNTYWHSNTLLLLKRAYRFFPVIEPILKEHNIPDDFKYVALIESGLRNVTSPAGASGYWQFMTKTAQNYGLEVNEYVDERNHIIKSTHAACAYLGDSYESCKNWAIAAAGYNMGLGRVLNSMGQQEVKSYYDLYLNAETSRYIYRILAIKLIYENPGNYGFYLREQDLYPPLKYKEITVDSSVQDLRKFAIEMGVNYKILKLFNPFLVNRKLINSNGKEYIIFIPDQKDLLQTELQKTIRDTLNIFNDTIRVNQL